jgi:hypothetical protein
MAAREFLEQGKAALERMRKCIEAFYEKFDILPAIDTQGGSACPFAEAMYRQAYQQESFLRDELEGLRLLIEGADAHIAQTERELNDADGPNEAMRRVTLDIDLGRARGMVVDLRRAGDRGRAALRDADRKRFPGMKRWTGTGSHR